jgi:hypothetical protein
LNSKKIDGALAFEKQACHGCAKVFAMSEYLRQSFIRDYDLPPERVLAIGAGINQDAIPEPRENKRYDNHEVLFIGVCWHCLLTLTLSAAWAPRAGKGCWIITPGTKWSDGLSRPLRNERGKE